MKDEDMWIDQSKRSSGFRTKGGTKRIEETKLSVSKRDESTVRSEKKNQKSLPVNNSICRLNSDKITTRSDKSDMGEKKEGKRERERKREK